MTTYYLRLDDACEKRDFFLWDKMEQLLDKYNIKPLVGVIPHCEDPMMDKYPVDEHFWDRVKQWENKGWTIALHGYSHVFETENAGINPVNKRSEFAGLPLERQKEKIKSGVKILRDHGIETKVFFAPAHTFDMNTLEALRQESDIRIVSDTVADKPYERWGFTFIPQQSGHVRKLPFNVVTFCYHPNTMKNCDFERLEAFICDNHKSFHSYQVAESKKKFSVLDRMLSFVYFARKK